MHIEETNTKELIGSIKALLNSDAVLSELPIIKAIILANTRYNKYFGH